MDSRTKIVAVSEALSLYPDGLWVVCHLDPMLATHARRLEHLAGQGRPLVLVVTDPPDPLLPTRSRAELAASLRCVSAVAIGNVPEGVEVASEEVSDIERRNELARHVHVRHSG